MIDKKETETAKLKLGLVLKKIITANKEEARDNKGNGNKDRDLITSFGKLESSTGLRKATLVDIFTANRSAGFHTIAAILNALDISFTEFATRYDALSKEEIAAYENSLEKAKKERAQERLKKKKK